MSPPHTASDGSFSSAPAPRPPTSPPCRVAQPVRQKPYVVLEWARTTTATLPRAADGSFLMNPPSDADGLGAQQRQRSTNRERARFTTPPRCPLHVLARALLSQPVAQGSMFPMLIAPSSSHYMLSSNMNAPNAELPTTSPRRRSLTTSNPATPRNRAPADAEDELRSLFTPDGGRCTMEAPQLT